MTYISKESISSKFPFRVQVDYLQVSKYVRLVSNFPEHVERGVDVQQTCHAWALACSWVLELICCSGWVEMLSKLGVLYNPSWLQSSLGSSRRTPPAAYSACLHQPAEETAGKCWKLCSRLSRCARTQQTGVAGLAALWQMITVSGST